MKTNPASKPLPLCRSCDKPLSEHTDYLCGGIRSSVWNPKPLASPPVAEIEERIWIASYTASKNSGVLSRGLRFRSIHNSKWEAEKVSTGRREFPYPAQDPDIEDFTVTEYVLATPTPEGTGWIACTPETLPPIGQTVIVRGGIAYRVEGEWISQTGGASGRPIMWPVTHWMKLPELPAAPAREAEPGTEGDK